jgi:hypothetical protein
MATLYKIEIKTVSPFSNFSEDHMASLFRMFLQDYRHPITGLGFEGTEIDVKKIA